MLLLIALCAMMAGSSGCGERKAVHEKICPGKTSAAEVLAVFAQRNKALTTFKASGKAVYHYIDNDKPRSESVKLIVQIDPPSRMSVVGNSVIGRVVQMGANDREFWLAVRPKEISKYLWGDWSGRDNESTAVKQCVDKFWFGPARWYEALGLIDANGGPAGTWKLSSWGGYDVLEKIGPNGKFVKRVYIYNCDYTVREIDYYDSMGIIIAVTEMSDYVAVEGAQDWKVPSKLRLVTAADTPAEQALEIELSNAAKAQFNDRQLELLFKRPAMGGFDHILKMGSDCEFVEQ
jgi:hypothetical protein